MSVVARMDLDGFQFRGSLNCRPRSCGSATRRAGAMIFDLRNPGRGFLGIGGQELCCCCGGGKLLCNASDGRRSRLFYRGRTK